MVGGGIFAVLGLSVVPTRGAAPVAFLIASSVALLTAASYAKLSVAYPSRGGTATFLNQVLGGSPRASTRINATAPIPDTSYPSSRGAKPVTGQGSLTAARNGHDSATTRRGGMVQP